LILHLLSRQAADAPRFGAFIKEAGIELY